MLTYKAMFKNVDGGIHAEVLDFPGAISFGADLDEARRMLEERYQGGWRSLEDWAESFMEDTGQLQGMPENLRCYFDFERFARDCELGGDIVTFEVAGEVHVFSSR